MTQSPPPDVLARARAILKADIGDVVMVAVPVGLAIGLPLTWSDGDRIGIYLVEREGRLRLVDDGAVIPDLEASGQLPEDGSWRERLTATGHAYDEDECEIWIDVPEIGAVAGKAMAMGRLLLDLDDYRAARPGVAADATSAA